jgi:hypothetical protein
LNVDFGFLFEFCISDGPDVSLNRVGKVRLCFLGTEKKERDKDDVYHTKG